MNITLALKRNQNRLLIAGTSVGISLIFLLFGRKLFLSPFKFTLMIALALIVFPLILRDIRLGIAGFIIISVFPRIQAHQIFGITGLNLMNIIFLLTTAHFFLPRIFFNIRQVREKIPLARWMGLLFTLQAVYVLRIMLGGYYYAGLSKAVQEQFLKPLQYYILLYILYHLIRSEKDVKFFYYAFYTTIVSVSLILSVQYIIHGPYSRIMWNSPIGGQKNAFAFTMAMFILMLMATYLNTNDIALRFFSFIGAFPPFIVLAFSLSRSAWAAFVIGVMFLAYKMKIGRTLVIFGLLAVIVILSPLSNFVMERASRNVETGNLDKILAGRVSFQWEVQWRGIKSNPLLGGGYHYDYGHNGYMSVWNKLGLLGLIISILLFVRIYRYFSRAFRNAKKSGLLKSLALAGCAIMAMVPFFNIPSSLQFIDMQDLGSMFLLLFVFLAACRLESIERDREEAAEAVETTR